MEEIELLKAVGKLRDAGYAIALYSEEELQGVDPRAIETAIHREGNEAIDDLRHLHADT
ncbi:hypothetical protein [Marinobacter sp. F3R08]|uniref:hypothetical protein n=1 Tax=Marinobacter sp. F3R08 TaxID=2841559 RepID=UPI001C0A1CA6|nr:hypothetical protein [Marinobacter sp. F3R08]MBU2952194.1 hypothetical protein [Marinobacter sp. F3R08]